MDVKFPQTKVYSPDREITESGDQLVLTFNMTFSDADFSKEFQASEAFKNTDLSKEEGEDFDEWITEFEKKELPAALKPKLAELLKLDTEEIPGFVDMQVEVDVYGTEASSLRGEVTVKVWVDLQSSKITDGVNLFFESLRQ